MRQTNTEITTSTKIAVASLKQTFSSTDVTMIAKDSQNCHSPTQPQLELELDLIMGRKPPHPTHTGTFKALPDNVGS